MLDTELLSYRNILVDTLDCPQSRVLVSRALHTNQHVVQCFRMSLLVASDAEVLQLQWQMIHQDDITQLTHPSSEIPQTTNSQTQAPQRLKLLQHTFILSILSHLTSTSSDKLRQMIIKLQIQHLQRGPVTQDSLDQTVPVKELCKARIAATVHNGVLQLLQALHCMDNLAQQIRLEIAPPQIQTRDIRRRGQKQTFQRSTSRSPKALNGLHP